MEISQQSLNCGSRFAQVYSGKLPLVILDLLLKLRVGSVWVEP